ncbi:hypothetical protein HZC09_03015 [Candidatus Micrarchaeota archaeon]|nr:hypothetical protein [Candidatus Micrarchaeota archaeon]
MENLLEDLGKITKATLTTPTNEIRYPLFKKGNKVFDNRKKVCELYGGSQTLPAEQFYGQLIEGKDAKSLEEILKIHGNSLARQLIHVAAYHDKGYFRVQIAVMPEREKHLREMYEKWRPPIKALPPKRTKQP